ncbi:tetratricopeptide repeat protein [Methylomonas sp. 2BW1-5-20]|uniref:tetratricopeptide repeat protein n=1 Tax=Methylomonas sp. 2BW1-5-20 TaxID=3376686 RepID=UPI004050EA88
MSESQKESTKSRILPSNPLGMIATFVFLIETVATVSLHAVSDKPYAVLLVWFIILYPTAIAFSFFILLWFKREALYAPMDFGDSDTFKDLILKKVERIEAKQDLSSINRDTDLNDIFKTIDRLLSLDDAWSAIGVGRAFLRQKDFAKASKVFDYVKSNLPKSSGIYYKPIANLAYAKIGMDLYDEAISMLEEVKKLNKGKNFQPWHSIALAYCYKKSGREQEYEAQISSTKEMDTKNIDKNYFADLYPEIANDILKL